MEKHLNNKDLQKVVTDLCWLHQVNQSTSEEIRLLEGIIAGFQYAKQNVVAFGVWQKTVQEAYTLEDAKTAFGDDWNGLSQTKKQMVEAILASFVHEDVLKPLDIILKQIELMQINFGTFLQGFKEFQKTPDKIKVPALSTKERDDMANAPVGFVIYNHTTQGFEKYNGSEWVQEPDSLKFEIISNTTLPTE